MVKQEIILGHEISSKGIAVDRSKVEVIAKLLEPKSLKDIRSFQGHTASKEDLLKSLAKLVNL